MTPRRAIPSWTPILNRRAETSADTHGNPASQNDVATRTLMASQPFVDTPSRAASHLPLDAHTLQASHHPMGTYERPASHPSRDTPGVGASLNDTDIPVADGRAYEKGASNIAWRVLLIHGLPGLKGEPIADRHPRIVGEPGMCGYP